MKLTTFEISRLARKKGFREPVLHHFKHRADLSLVKESNYINGQTTILIKDWNNNKLCTSRPYQSQLLQWLENKHNIIVEVYPNMHSEIHYDYLIHYNIRKEKRWVKTGNNFINIYVCDQLENTDEFVDRYDSTSAALYEALNLLPDKKFI